MDADQVSYAVWITGFRDNIDPENCRGRLAAVFGVTAERVDELFFRIPCELKSGLPRAEAQRYEAVLTLVGVISEIRPQQLSAPASDVSTMKAAQPRPASLFVQRLSRATQRAVSRAAPFALPAVLVLGALAGAGAMFGGAQLFSTSPRTHAGDGTVEARLLAPLDAAEREVLAKSKASIAARTLEGRAPIFEGVNLQLPPRGTPNSACVLNIARQDRSGQNLPGWWSLGVVTGANPPQLILPRYFVEGPPPTLTIGDHRVRMETALSPQTAMVKLDRELLHSILHSDTVQVQYGKDASGEVAFTYDVRQLASAMRLARELCGGATPAKASSGES